MYLYPLSSRPNPEKYDGVGRVVPIAEITVMTGTARKATMAEDE